MQKNPIELFLDLVRLESNLIFQVLRLQMQI